MSTATPKNPQERRALLVYLADRRAQGVAWSQISTEVGQSAELLARHMYVETLNAMQAEHPTDYASMVTPPVGGDIDKWLQSTALVIRRVEATRHSQPGNTPHPNDTPAAFAEATTIGRPPALVKPNRQPESAPASPPTTLPPLAYPTDLVLRAAHFLVRCYVTSFANVDPGVIPGAPQIVDDGQNLLAELTGAINDSRGVGAGQY